MALRTRKPSIMFAVPTGLGYEIADVGRWIAMQAWELGQAKAVSKFFHVNQRSSRILLNRNSFVEIAIKEQVDYLCMVDPDMVCDYYCNNGTRQTSGEQVPVQRLENQQPFLPTAIEFFKRHPFSVLGAPAVCDPPAMRVNAYLFEDDPKSKSLGRPATHAEAAQRVKAGVIEHVAAIGTGLIIIPIPVLWALDQPYFDDVYNDSKTKLEKSQDVYFTENLTRSGVEVYCAWCSWCGHHKASVLGCPGIDTDEPQSSGWQAPVTLG